MKTLTEGAVINNKAQTLADRVHKSILNAKVNLLFYFLSLFFAFFSRKIFLDCLGAEFIGLTGTLNNILGYLNLAELGISGSIAYFLYKPLQQGNRKEIADILSLFGYLYRWIGYVILAGGLAISLSFPWLFDASELGLGIVYFSFFSILGSSLIGYFINYRQILLSADQKDYLVAVYFQSANLLKTAVQITLAYTYQNPYVWVAIEFLFGVIGCLVLNWKIDREYPWLKTEKSRGRELLKRYPDVMVYTRQIFIHKIKDFLLYKSDELFIFAFVSLKMVAYYGNYVMITTKIGQVFSAMMNSLGASIGNLIAEGNKQNTQKVFWEMLTMRHFVAGLLCFAIYHCIEPFIEIWLGAEYILSKDILVLLLVVNYVGTSRTAVDSFNAAYGLFADTWSAWLELVMNVTMTILFGMKWGIAGILLSKAITTSTIGVFWKPYYLFRSGLKMSYADYWRGAARNYLVSGASFIAAHYLLRLVSIPPAEGWTVWVAYSAAALAIYLCINVTLTLLLCRGARDSMQRIQVYARQKMGK